MSKIKDLATRISEALLDYSTGSLTVGVIATMISEDGRKKVRAERISIIERLISAEFPENPLPAPTNKSTDPNYLEGQMLAETFAFILEGTLMTKRADQAALVAKHDQILQAQLTFFKRAVRDEAFAEFTEGASKADEMLGASLGRGK